MILIDKEIKKRVSNHELIIENYNEKNVGGISYDLTIAEFVGYTEAIDAKDTFQLEPGQAIFIRTKEKLHIPNDILGRIAQKNSRMRMGLYVDGPHYQPGHETYAFLRVHNMSSNIISLKSGDQIAQIIFEQLSESPEQLYTDSSQPFANETNYRGLSTYKKKYQKQIQSFEKVKQDIESKEAQIYANVLTIVGIISAVFSIITINFEAFKNTTLDLKYILVMNLSLVFSIVVFFGLLYIITNKKSNKHFFILFSVILSVVILSIIAVLIFL